MDKDIIAKNFSKCAHIYDRYANIQMDVAARLARLLPEVGVRRVLEIGCGTGNYTALLKNRFGSSSIKALDISEEMVDVARRKLDKGDIEFIVGDAEEFEADEKFDLVTSNAAFQWLEDLDRSLLRFRGALKENGKLVFSTFGPRTFFELRKALGGDSPVASRDFLDKEDLEEILKKRFSKVRMKTLIVKEVYPSLAELLRKIRYTGVKGCGNRAFPLKKAEVLYKRAFGRVEATYEIYLCSGDRY